MLTRALRRPTLALAAVVVAGTALYALIFLDPYISLIMLPFFAAGCARGKHPAVLMALAAAPVLLLLAVSQIKFRLTGWPLVNYDQFFLRQNVLMLQGWLVLRFTWEQITQRPHKVLAAVRAAVTQRVA